MRDINQLYSQQTYQQIMQDIPNYKSYDNLLYKMRDIIEQFSYELKNEVIDILSRIFPSFALQDTDSKYTKYDEISEYKWENDQENNWQVDSWERVLSQLCMLLDVVDQITIYLFLKLKRISPITEKYLKEKFKIKEILKLAITDQNLPFTSDETQAINEFSLTRLYKEFFCIVCQVYDCQIHGLNDVSTKNYYHPQTSSKQKNSENLYFLNNFYINNLVPTYQNEVLNINKSKQSITSSNNLEQEQCSKFCYKYLNAETYKQLQISYIKSQQKFSDFDKSMIQLGIQNFSYDPCKIWINNYQNLTCQQVFLYLFEELEINKGIYFDQIQLYEAKVQQHGKEHYKKKVQKKSLYGIGNKYGAIDPVLGYTYQPCMHYSHDGKLVPEEEQKCKQCICAKRKFCDKFCMCDPQKCTIRRKGCSCTSNCKNKKCDCYAGGFECDPDLCKGCFNQEIEQKKNLCQNNEILLGKDSKCIISDSKVCQGLGLFAIFPIEKNALVQEYLGEIIETAENQLREKFDGNNNFYSFQLTNQDKLIDGKYFGNKSRFINHQSQNPNCITKVVYSQGDWHLGIYAQKDIEIGEELLFNYDGDGTLKSMFNWIEQEEEQKTKKKKQNRQQNINSKSNLSIEMEEELGEISFDSKIYYNNNDDGEDEEDYQDSFEIPMTNA